MNGKKTVKRKRVKKQVNWVAFWVYALTALSVGALIFGLI